MAHDRRAQLVELGLSLTEAQVYLALIQNASLSASALATATDLSRTSVYQILCSLTDKGLVQSGAGYGSKFAVVAPEQALPALVAREKQTIAERERIADELAETLAPLVADAEFALDDTVQVIRTPHAITQRYERLQLEAERTIDATVKAPILNPRKNNPAQEKAQRRGVHYRGLYEKAAIEDAAIKPNLQAWIAGGEEARVYDGELPYKLTIFDGEIALITLTKRGDTWLTLFVRHEPLAKSLTEWFNLLWEKAKPLTPTAAPAHPGSARASRAADGVSPSGGKIVSAGAPKPAREGAGAPRTKNQTNRDRATDDGAAHR